jgi:thiamine-phosphate pyrophosphorylase
MTASDAAALLLDPGQDATALAWLQRDLMPRLADRSFAVIIKDAPDLVASIGADGIHLSDDVEVKKLRSKFADLSIGVTCPPERHEAMIAAELGANYIAFDTATAEVGTEQLLPLIHWWGEMMTVPSVAFAETPETALTLVKAGADFIAIAPTIWQQSDPISAIQGFVKTLAG